MRLSAIAIQKINNTPTRLRLALLLGCTERWISNLIKANEENGDLTKAGSVKLIQEETGLRDEEILESEPVEESK